MRRAPRVVAVAPRRWVHCAEFKTFVPEFVGLRPRRWGARHLARAAAILLAVLIPGAFALDYLAAARQRDHHAAHQAELRQRVSELNRETAALPQERAAKLEAVHHDVRARQLKLVVSGPASVQAGGVNEYQIQTRDGNDQLVPATIVAAPATAIMSALSPDR